MSTVYRCRTQPPAAVVAAAGWVAWRTLGIAYLGSTGSWYLRSRVRAPSEMSADTELHTDLYAVAAAINDHPGLLEIQCEYVAVVELIRDWQAGRTEPVPGYTGSRLTRLGSVALARADTLALTWVPKHAWCPLNKGADALARLASRVGTDRLGAPEIRRRATLIAFRNTTAEVTS